MLRGWGLTLCVWSLTDCCAWSGVGGGGGERRGTHLSALGKTAAESAMKEIFLSNAFKIEVAE